MVSLSNLSQRILTAIVGIVLILALIIYGGELGVTLLALLGCMGALYEYFVINFSFSEQRLQRWVGILIGICLSMLIVFQSSWLYEGISLFFIFIFVFYLSLTHLYGGNHSKLFSDLASTLAGIFFVSFLFSFLPKIRALDDGIYWIFLVFLIPWLSDTAAYFVGRAWGVRKLAPSISPHKTKEGAVAGLLVAVLGVFLYKLFIFSSLSLFDCLVLGLVGSLFSQVGDLFESFIKRAFAVKDSGAVIPGHGGILDRFDGVLFCGPFLYFYVRFL